MRASHTIARAEQEIVPSSRPGFSDKYVSSSNSMSLVSLYLSHFGPYVLSAVVIRENYWPFQLRNFVPLMC